jgi:hypothetical protein
MKKLQIIAFFGIAVAISSCGSVTRVSRESVSAPIIYSTRDDISITDDISSTGKVKDVSVLFIDFYRWGDSKKQLKIGPFRFFDRNYEEGVFSGYAGLYKDFDEKIAVYNFISQNQSLDYVTNIRYKKTYTRKPFYWKALNIGVRETQTTIIAKGVILKNKIPAKK